MTFREIDYRTGNISKDSIFSEIYSRSAAGYIIRGFFSAEELDILMSIFENYPRPYFQPYDGFDSLPRPFNFIFKTEQFDWKEECNYIFDALETFGIAKLFREKLQLLAGETKVIYSSPHQQNTFSRSWSSLRRLAPNKGMFEVHCGRLFQEENTIFYNFFRQNADIDVQMTFLMIVDKPEDVDSDINIYDAHWEEVGEKLDQETLKKNDGTILPLHTIPCSRIKLNPGDILFFDEGNYWHSVPLFSGNKSRLSFGGFITKYLSENTVQFWV